MKKYAILLNGNMAVVSAPSMAAARKYGQSCVDLEVRRATKKEADWHSDFSGCSSRHQIVLDTNGVQV